MRFAAIALLLALTPDAQSVRGSREPLVADRRDTAPGLQIELRARDNRTSFHLYESIPVEVRISSTSPRTYAIELDRGWNAVAGDVEFMVSPADNVIRPLSFPAGFTCCSSHRPFLTRTPHVFRYYLTQSVRFLRPGDYQIQFRTHEVFRSARTPNDQFREAGDVSAISNVVTLTILPDDPTWDAASLKESISVLDDPQAAKTLETDRQRIANAFGPHVRGPRARRLPGPAAMRYYDAEQSLAVLDTPDAIRERVARLRMPSERRWRQSKRNGYSGIGGALVIDSTRPDLIVAAIEARASQPNFGVQYGYAMLWIRALMQRDTPQLSSLLTEQPRDAGIKARAAVTDFLMTVLSSKVGLAHEMTTDTIQMLRREK